MSLVDEEDPKYAPFRQMLGQSGGPGPGGPLGGGPGPGGGPLGALASGANPADLEKMLKGLSPAELDELMKQCSAGLDQQVSQGMSNDPMAMLNKVDDEGGVLVQPAPGFVIKTEDLESGQKVFINATSSDFVEKPHEKSVPDAPASEMGIRVPVSVGEAMEDFDKKNTPCLTYDCVMNPAAIEASDEDPNFRHMVVQLLLGSVAQKYSLQLNPKYRLPKMKYKGPDATRLQRLKVKRESQIEEVASRAPDIDAEAAPPFTFSVTYEAEGEEPFDGLTLPVYSEEVALQANLRTKVFRQDADQEGLDKVLARRTCVITVNMPEVKTAASIEIDISDECARVSTAGLRVESMMLWFPLEFCARLAAAEWRAAERQLVLRVPCSPFVGDHEPAEDPTVFSNALADVTF